MPEKLKSAVRKNDKNNGIDHTIAYLKSFIKDKNVASVTPTSANVVRAICNRMDFSRDIFLVEYGAGTGVFTFEILNRMTPGSRLLAFETNAQLAAKLGRRKDPRLMVSNQSATEVVTAIEQHDLPRPNYVISGIPFSFLDVQSRKQLVMNTNNLLLPGGRFLVYQVSWLMKETLGQVFGNCSTASYLRNLPPVFLMDSLKQ